MSAGSLADARAAWAAHGVARVADVAPPGLVAELVMGFLRAPLIPFEQPREVVWAYDVGVPPVRDPQLFTPLFELVPILDEVIPRLASEVCGRPLVAAAPTTLRLVAYRKGSWTDGPLGDAAGAVAATLALTTATWPEAWGGHLRRGDRHGQVVERAPLPAGAVELAELGCPRQVPVLRRHVERLEVRTILVPAGEVAP